MYKVSTLFISLAIFCFSSLSYSGIAEFNEAVRSGDYETAAAETIKIWESFNKKSPQTATIAREFGFVNYMAKDYENAEMFARYLVEKGDALPTPDDQPLVSRVLLSLSKFAAVKNKENMENLQNALRDRLSVDGLDNISFVASEMAYMSPWRSGNWVDAHENAKIAIDLNSRAGKRYLTSLRKSQYVGKVAGFLDEPKESDLAGMLELQEDIVKDLNSGLEDEDRKLLESINWQLLAWAFTADRYFFYNNVKTSNAAGIKAVSLNDNTVSECSLDLNIDNLTYPEEWVGSNTMGVVVVQLEFNENGRLNSHNILGEAPPNMFSEAVERNANTFQIANIQNFNNGTCDVEYLKTIRAITFFPECVELFRAGKCGSLDKRINRYYHNIQEPVRMFHEAGTGQVGF